MTVLPAGSPPGDGARARGVHRHREPAARSDASPRLGGGAPARLIEPLALHTFANVVATPRLAQFALADFIAAGRARPSSSPCARRLRATPRARGGGDRDGGSPPQRSAARRRACSSPSCFRRERTKRRCSRPRGREGSQSTGSTSTRSSPGSRASPSASRRCPSRHFAARSVSSPAPERARSIVFGEAALDADEVRLVAFGDDEHRHPARGADRRAVVVGAHGGPIVRPGFRGLAPADRDPGAEAGEVAAARLVDADCGA